MCFKVYNLYSKGNNEATWFKKSSKNKGNNTKSVKQDNEKKDDQVGEVEKRE